MLLQTNHNRFSSESEVDCANQALLISFLDEEMLFQFQSSELADIELLLSLFELLVE